MCLQNQYTRANKVKSKWEHDYRFKNLKYTRTTVVCTYPVNDVLPTISDSTGPIWKMDEYFIRTI
jgi:hypothetical protein